MGGRPIRTSLHRRYLAFLDLLFPPRCVRCQRLGQHWCANCQQGVARAPVLACPRCGLPQPMGRLCRDCRAHPPAYDVARSRFRYSARLRPVIVSLKYRPNPGLGQLLAEYLAAYLGEQPWRPDLLLPIPLADDRTKERGFNQAEVLARPLSGLTGLALSSDAILRVRPTPKQVGLDFDQRKANMRGAFAADAAQVRGKQILLVDDVMTTGATLNAAATALKEAGADRVFGITVARATL